LIIANGTTSNNVNPNDQQNAMVWDVDALNGGNLMEVKLIIN